MVRTPTVEDVALRAGVSRQTVSNVLNTPPSIVKPATRERVQQAIVELGYRRHAAARQLRTRRSSTIGSIWIRMWAVCPAWCWTASCTP